MKRILIALTSAMLLSLLCAGCAAQSSNADKMNTQPPQKTQKVDTFGIVKSADVTDIWLDFPAVVNDVNIKEGQKVKKGEVLMTLNYDAYLNEINSKTIELKYLKKQSGSIDKEILNEKIKACESEIKLMKDKMEKANISGNNVISHLDNSVVYDLGYVKGEALNSSKKIASLLNLDKLIIESNVPEEFIKDVKPGSEVTIIPQADKSRTYKGKVTYIAGKAVQQNGQTTVLIQSSIDNNDGFLMPDFNVTLEIAIAK